MTPNGYPEEVYMTFSYSPIRDGEDGGGIAGLFCVCTEETRRVLAEWRLCTLRDLAGATAEARPAEEAAAAAASRSGRTRTICPSPCSTCAMPTSARRRWPG